LAWASAVGAVVADTKMASSAPSSGLNLGIGIPPNPVFTAALLSAVAGVYRFRPGLE
jgi:hypothetical protein